MVVYQINLDGVNGWIDHEIDGFISEFENASEEIGCTMDEIAKAIDCIKKLEIGQSVEFYDYEIKCFEMKEEDYNSIEKEFSGW